MALPVTFDDLPVEMLGEIASHLGLR